MEQYTYPVSNKMMCQSSGN